MTADTAFRRTRLRFGAGHDAGPNDRIISVDKGLPRRGENLAGEKAQQVHGHGDGFNASVGLQVKGRKHSADCSDDFIDLHMQRDQVDKNRLQIRARCLRGVRGAFS